MSVNGIGNSAGFDISKMASTIAAKMVKGLDTNEDGSLDKNEFVTGLTAKGISATDAAKQFDNIDTTKSGKVTQADIEADIKTSARKGGTPPGGKGGPPPGGGPGGGKASGSAGQTGGSSTTSSAKTYDKMDLNRDGTVTTEEALVYGLKHPAVVVTDRLATPQKLGNNLDVTA